jgi:hypothetical protein
MTEEQDPRRLTGDAAWKAHLDSVDKRNAVAKKKAAERRSTTDLAAIARSRQLKGP